MQLVPVAPPPASLSFQGGLPPTQSTLDKSAAYYVPQQRPYPEVGNKRQAPSTLPVPAQPVEGPTKVPLSRVQPYWPEYHEYYTPNSMPHFNGGMPSTSRGWQPFYSTDNPKAKLNITA